MGTGAVGFVALVPLWVALSGWRGRPDALPGQSFRRGFQLGLITGGVHYAGTVYWTGATVQTFGGLPWPVAIITALLLVLYMSIYVAVAAGVTGRFVRAFGWVGLPLGAAAWVTTEYARGWLFGGFPWIPLGNTMVTLLPVAQLASARRRVPPVAVRRARQCRLRARDRLRPTPAAPGPGPHRARHRRHRRSGAACACRPTPSSRPARRSRWAWCRRTSCRSDKWNGARAGQIVERYSR